MRKQFATTIEEEAADKFREACDSRGVKMNTVLEAFMEQFYNNNFSIEISKSGMTLKLDK